MKSGKLQLTKKMVTRLPLVKTPASNTGLNSQPSWSVGIDWLDITIRGIESGRDRDDVISAFETILNSPADFCSTRATFNGKQWAGSGQFESGARIWWNPPREPQSNDYSVSDSVEDVVQQVRPATNQGGLDSESVLLWNSVVNGYVLVEAHAATNDMKSVRPLAGESHPDNVVGEGGKSAPLVGEIKLALTGSSLGRVSAVDIFDYLSVISSIYLVDCSRIDVALDDNTKSVSIRDVASASVEGDYFNARYSQRIESGNRGEDVGQTVYFGSPRSDAKMRVYDKTVESKGICDCNRWEVEFHRKKADYFFEQLRGWFVEGTSVVAQKLVDVVVNFIDFRDRSSGDPNRGRCPRLQWYADMLNALCKETVRVRVPAPVVAMQKTIDWIGRSVAQSISSVQMALGDEFWPYMQAILSSGKARMSNMRRKIAASSEKDKLVYDKWRPA